jgi:hypothetical protein
LLLGKTRTRHTPLAVGKVLTDIPSEIRRHVKLTGIVGEVRVAECNAV